MEGRRRSPPARAGARRAARRAGRSSRSCRPPRARCAARLGDVTAREPRCAPSVSGDPRVGGTLTCDRGTLGRHRDAPYDVPTTSGSREDYGEAIDGADAATYVVTAEDAGRRRCSARCTRVNGQRGLATRSPTRSLARAPESRSAPRLSGDARLGGELRCTRGVWDDRDLPPYATTFAWLRDGEAIEGAETDRYIVTAADLGHRAGLRGDRRGRVERRPAPSRSRRRRVNRVLPGARRRPADRRRRDLLARRLGRRGPRAVRGRLPVAARRRADRARAAPSTYTRRARSTPATRSPAG